MRSWAAPELPLLVALAVGGQLALGHDAEDAAAVDHHRRVTHALLGPKRSAHDHHRLKVGAPGDDSRQRLGDGGPQRGLVEEILAAVRRQSELGEHDQGSAGVRRLPGQGQCSLCVEVRVGDPHVRYGGGDAYVLMARGVSASAPGEA